MNSKTKDSPKLKASKNQGNPQTMEELLAQTGYTPKGLKKGQEVKGKITSISSKSVFVDIGGKAEAVVLGREFEAVADFLKNLKVGQEITANVAALENDQGQTILSLRKYAATSSWEKAIEANKKKTEVEGEIIAVTQGGFLIQVLGLSGFLPTSQVGSILGNEKTNLVGKKIKVRIIEVIKDQNRLIVSERMVSEKEKIEKLGAVLKKAKEGLKVQAEVTGVAPFGLFVKTEIDKEEIEGLIHISEIAWEKIEDAGKLYQVGDKLEALVIGIDEGNQKLALSLKKLKTDPWLEIVKKYHPESKVSGEVKKLTAYGAFVEVEPGVEGLIHVSKISPQIKIEVGDRLDCFVEAIDEEKRRLSLVPVPKGKPVGYK